MAWKKVRLTGEVTAQRVSKKAGEHVSTLNGPVFAPFGSYVIRERASKDTPWALRVLDEESYKAQYVAL